MKRYRATFAAIACAVPLVFGVAACGDDDDAASTSATSTAPLTSTAPGDLDGLIATAVTDYRAFVDQQVDAMIADAKVFTDAIRAGDLEAAQAAFGPSREAWESIEPIAGLIESIDTKVDVRADFFEDLDDPNFTGWHRLEYLLFERGTTEGAAPYADQLDADLAQLKEDMATLEIPPVDVARGAGELIEEVAEGKMTGEEDRYSKTDLWDLNANVVGAKKVIELLTPALQVADPALLARIQTSFAAMDETIDTLRDGDGFILFCPPASEYPSDLCPEPTLTAAQVNTLKTQFGGLAEDLSQVPGALGLS